MRRNRNRYVHLVILIGTGSSVLHADGSSLHVEVSESEMFGLILCLISLLIIYIVTFFSASATATRTSNTVMHFAPSKDFATHSETKLLLIEAIRQL
jgi:hypothetical protein